MSRFLKLTHGFINTAHITRILHHANETSKCYSIYMNDADIAGTFFFTVGWLDSKYKPVEVHSDKHAADYHLIKEWLEREEFGKK